MDKRRIRRQRTEARNPRVLVTGFTAFGSVAENPSQRIAEMLAARSPEVPDAQIRCEVLETSYSAAEKILTSVIRRFRPEIVVSFGVAAGRSRIEVERFALNLDDAVQPDNAGEVREDSVIAESGPTAYGSTLPVDDLSNHLDALGYPTSASNHAGTFLCNHVFYLSRHLTRRRRPEVWAGFVHVPLHFAGKAAGDESRWNLDQLLAAAEAAVRFLISRWKAHHHAVGVARVHRNTRRSSRRS